MYWLQDGIMKIDLPAGEPTLVGTSQPISSFAVDQPGAPGDAVVYLVGDGGVHCVEPATGASKLLAHETGTDIIIDAENIYWASGAPGSASILRLPK